MTSHAPEMIALALVADGKGILAADETVPTLTGRFEALGIVPIVEPEVLMGRVRPPMIRHTVATGATTDSCNQ